MNNSFSILYDHEMILDIALMNVVQNRIDSGSLPHAKANVCEETIPDARVKVFGELELKMLRAAMISNN
jgi:hypothetical protein